jgi:hypothetical protein
MLSLTLIRYASTKDSTLGMLFRDSKYNCLILEDGHRFVKEYGKTRIPAGTYEIKLRYAGGWYRRMKSRFTEAHPMLWLQNVPGFTYIYFHPGNKVQNTEGCLLTGSSHFFKEGNYAVSESTKSYLKLHAIIMTKKKLFEKVFITIIDFDRTAKPRIISGPKDLGIKSSV